MSSCRGKGSVPVDVCLPSPRCTVRLEPELLSTVPVQAANEALGGVQLELSLQTELFHGKKSLLSFPPSGL